MIHLVLPIKCDVHFLQYTVIPTTAYIVIIMWILLKDRALRHGAATLGIGHHLIEILAIVSLEHTFLEFT